MNKEFYHKMRVDFTNNYKKVLNPKLRKYEAQRLEKLKFVQTAKNWIIGIIGIIITIALFGIIIFGNFSFFCIQLIVISIFVYSIIKHCVFKNFENSLKEECLNELCKCFGNLEWRNGQIGLENYNQIPKTSLFQKYNKERYDDIFKGSYNDVDFEILEADYDYVSGSGENKKTYNIFKGIIVRISMNKPFECHTVIRPHKMTNTNSHLKRTILEDVIFENKYDVYTNDEIEARYLITTAFMERLNNIQRIFTSQKVACAFYNKNLYIAVYTNKDLFKLFDINKTINDYEQFMVFFNEILSIYKCIDYFKLNEKTGL